MSIVNFTNARFTPSDIRLFYDVAMLQFWREKGGAISRMSSSLTDSLSVFGENHEVPLFLFMRDFKGVYKLYQFIEEKPFLVGFGFSADICLRAYHRDVFKSQKHHNSNMMKSVYHLGS